MPSSRRDIAQSLNIQSVLLGSLVSTVTGIWTSGWPTEPSLGTQDSRWAILRAAGEPVGGDVFGLLSAHHALRYPMYSALLWFIGTAGPP